MVSKTGWQTNEQTLYNILPGLVFPFMVICVIHAVSYTQDAVIQIFQDPPCYLLTLWCQLEDTFQLIVTPQGMELVMVHIEVISQCLKKYRVEYKACYIFLLDTIQL